MHIATLKGAARTPGGRHANERLRRGGMIPAIVYGHGEAPETVAISRHELELALRGHAHVVQVDIAGKVTQFFLKEVQYDHLDQTPIHADLMRVDPNERIEVSVGLELRGTPAGIALGGELIQVLSDLEVECKLLEIPDSIRVKIDHLNIGDSLHVKDLELPPDVRPLHEPEDLVLSVRLKRIEEEAAAAAPAEGATAEPEVIGRVAKEKTEGEEK